MENQLLNLIQNGENEEMSFFVSSENQYDIARNVSAFANTNGGVLFFGVRKNGKIAGIEPSETYSSIANAASDLCIPEVEIDIHTIQVNHKIIIVVQIPKSTTLHKVIEEEELNLYIRHFKNPIKTNLVLKRFLELKLEKKTISMEISQEEQTILDLLTVHPSISMTQLAKKMDIKRDYLENHLAHLLYKEKINYSVEGEKITFHIQ